VLVFVAGYVDFDAPGEYHTGLFVSGLLIMLGAFYMARGIQMDKADGTVIRILAGPVTMRTYLVQNFLAAMVPVSVLSVFLGLIGMARHSWGLTFAIGIVLCYALLGATSIGLSFVWSCLFKDKEASAAVFSVVITVLATIGGLMIPISILPTMVRRIGALTPAHWAARGMETLMNDGMSGQFWLSLTVMLLFVVIYLLYGGRRRIM